MYKKIMVMLGVLMLLTLTACGPGEQTTDVSPYIGGTRGLISTFGEMGVFSDITGHNEIYESESFPIEVTIGNKGEYEVDVGKLTITLKGINLNDFSGIVTSGILSNTQLIEKISEFNALGGETQLDFTPGAEDAIYTPDMNVEVYDVDVFGEVVYEYKTFSVVPKVCFKENLQDVRICNVDETKQVFSSGAPIQIVSAEEKGAGTGKIAVEYVIQNVGGGDVALTTDEFDRRYDQVGILVDNEAFECKGPGGRTGVARFDESGSATIICKLKEALPTGTLYTAQLGLTLEYKYRELIQESIRIRGQ
ncbi:MAG: hypothetical protein KJ601_04345 [Nanoarchaeota archaeon]|nr:hypothetical protein [Nanoarchaeota archaeon]MBU1704253.1 hypothetical protein [Nanoarchaeota archaeon]